MSEIRESVVREAVYAWGELQRTHRRVEKQTAKLLRQVGALTPEEFQEYARRTLGEAEY